MDWWFTALNGLLCAAALVAAAHVPEPGRRAALLLAGLLAVDWIFYVLAWSPFKPSDLFGGLLNSKDLWSIMDAAVGVAAVGLAYRFWWGWALWLSVLGQELLHGLYWFHCFKFETYSGLLDKVFLAQIALFLLMGGRGVVDRLHRGLDILRVSLRRSRSAHARARWSDDR